MPAIVIAESFETGALGDYLRLSNCPGLTFVYSAGNGIFVADPHSGSQAAKLSNGLGSGGMGLSASSVELEAPSGATEIGFFLKIAAPDPVQTGSMVMAQIGWKPPGILSGSTEYLQTVFVYDAPGSLRLIGSVGGFDATYILTPDAWYEFNFKDTGDWSLSLVSGVVASGSLGPVPADRVLYATVNGEAGGLNTVDEFYYRPAPIEPPIARLYPRDDGLGIDGNARIHPPPKSRRIVGGHL